eukprot:g57035.t1
MAIKNRTQAPAAEKVTLAADTNPPSKYMWPLPDSTRVFLINLKRRADRLQHMQALARELGLQEQLRIFEALDGKALGQEQLRQYATNTLGIRANLTFAGDFSQGDPLAVKALSLSVLTVLSEFLASGDSTLLLLEDDLTHEDGENAAVALSVIYEYLRPLVTTSEQSWHFPVHANIYKWFWFHWRRRRVLFSRAGAELVLKAGLRNPNLPYDWLLSYVLNGPHSLVYSALVFQQAWGHLSSSMRPDGENIKMLTREARAELHMPKKLQRFLTAMATQRALVLRGLECGALVTDLVALIDEALTFPGQPPYSVQQVLGALQLSVWDDAKLFFLAHRLKQRVTQTNSALAELFQAVILNFSERKVSIWPEKEKLKVVVLNLAKREDRREHMQIFLQLLGLEKHASFYTALDGKDLGEEGLRQYAAARRLGLPADIVFANRYGDAAAVAATA